MKKVMAITYNLEALLSSFDGVDKHLLAEKVKHAVVYTLELESHLLDTRTRKQPYPFARQLTAWILHMYFDLSITYIGSVLNVQRQTVNYSVNYITERIYFGDPLGVELRDNFGFTKNDRAKISNSEFCKTRNAKDWLGRVLFNLQQGK